MSLDANDSAPSGDAPVEMTAARPSSDNDNAAAKDVVGSKPSDDKTSPVDSKEKSSDTNSASVQDKEDSKVADGNAIAAKGNEDMALSKDVEPKKKKKSKKSKSLKKKATGFEGELTSISMPIVSTLHYSSLVRILTSFSCQSTFAILPSRPPNTKRRGIPSIPRADHSLIALRSASSASVPVAASTARKNSCSAGTCSWVASIPALANFKVSRHSPSVTWTAWTRMTFAISLPTTSWGAGLVCMLLGTTTPMSPSTGRLTSLAWPLDSCEFIVISSGCYHADHSSSETLPRLTTPGAPDYAAGVDVVSNFLKYVDLHDVCPEYAEDLKRAQQLCQKAREEMPQLARALFLLPGDFGTAARRVTCDDYDEFGWDQLPVDMDIKTARQNVGIVMSILMSSKCGHEKGIKFGELEGMPTVTKAIAKQAYEVVGIVLPNDECHLKFKSINKHLADMNKDLEGEAVVIKPCGILQVKPTVIRSGWENTMHKTVEDVTYNLVMEEEILALMKVGFKFEWDICLFNYGVGFVKTPGPGHPTFYEFLPQELMWGYKEPEMNPRPGPSIHNPTGAFEGGAGMGDLNDEPEGDAAPKVDVAKVDVAKVDVVKVDAPMAEAPVDASSRDVAMGHDGVEWEL